jgi:uncharacterized protein YfaS (alpha-2-macroglobulin family)
VKGGKFVIDATDQDHAYSVYWTLNLEVTDDQGRPMKNTDVTVTDKNGKIVLKTKTDDNGEIKKELQEYSVNGQEKDASSPYTILIEGHKKTINLDRNKTVEMLLE